MCHASIEAIGKAAQELLPLHFPAGPSAPSLTYAVQYEHRASVNLDRDELIKKVVEDVDKVSQASRVRTWERGRGRGLGRERGWWVIARVAIRAGDLVS